MADQRAAGLPRPAPVKRQVAAPRELGFSSAWPNGAAADVAMEEIPDLFSGEAVFGGLQSLEDAIGVSDSNDIHLLSLTASLRNAIMAVVTVRNLPEETHRALRMQAARHGRSTEAEIRAILQRAVQPEVRTRIGQQLAAFGKKHGGLDLEVDRDPRSTEAADFG
jgi:plasmid stability protein